MSTIKLKKIAVGATVLVQFLVGGLTLANPLPVRVYATDTVAGYGTQLRTSSLHPGDDVIFVVEKSDGGVIRVEAKVDLSGVAQTEFFGQQTKKAGLYRVAMTYPGSRDASPQSAFQVFPDRPSMTQSTLAATKQMAAADGKDQTFVTVTLFDAYRNPVQDHQIKLISSRSDDTVSALQSSATDTEGRVYFSVASAVPGISVFSAIDMTLNQVLSGRNEVVFYTPTSDERAVGGNYLSADMTQAGDTPVVSPGDLTGPVDHFEITSLPATVKVNEDQYLTVTARDKDNNVARNYTGTILISVPEDENAALPNNGEYTFKEADQGKFNFNLALRFSKVGKQAVQVFDKNDWKISGEANVEVVPTQAVIPNSADTGLQIKSPMDGAELGSTLIILTGQGDPNINLKVFDNDIKIGESETDTTGFFSFQVKNLQSGMHGFYVMSDSGSVSSVVLVKIDTIPPVIDRFELIPEGIVAPGTTLTVKVSSEPRLQEAKVRLQGVEQLLQEQASQPGAYTATLAAPSVTGNFPLDVILTDNLANKAELLNKATVTVQAPQKAAPPQVQNVNGQAGDRQVTLAWDAVTPTDKPIQKYRIAYGSIFTELSQTIDTPDAATMYTVQNLENAHQYFFALSAVDTDATEGKKSVVIAVTPTMPQPITMPPAVTAGTLLQGSPMDSAASLVWSPVPDIPVYAYRIYFGLKSGAYDDFLTTPNQPTNMAVHDLINGIPYYFAVAALDGEGHEISPLSNEVVLTPDTAAAHRAATDLSNSVTPAPDYAAQLQNVPKNNETGSDVLLVILASFVGAGFFYFYKRRLIKSYRVC
ncbi:fibronectin type III domain-containing protein [Candidatus Peregrinibacteria bacterium]|nr:fibronectin type III domain-containing protein [Candidatus Peregrinibacteria bacterium]